MYSIKLEERLAKLFLFLSDCDREVEANREFLNQLDFNPHQIFKILDTECKNYINNSDIVNFLKSKDINVHPEEARFIIYFNDTDSDGKLSYLEFLNFISCESSLSIDNYNEVFCYPSTSSTLNSDIENYLLKLFESELYLIRNLQLVLKDLRSTIEFNVSEFFSSIQLDSNVSRQELERFLFNQNVFVGDREIRAMMRRLDLNRDMKISLNEFKNFFLFSPSTVAKD